MSKTNGAIVKELKESIHRLSQENEALKATFSNLMGYLKLSHEQQYFTATTGSLPSQAQMLRQQANEIEARDEAILKARSLLGIATYYGGNTVSKVGGFSDIAGTLGWSRNGGSGGVPS